MANCCDYMRQRYSTIFIFLVVIILSVLGEKNDFPYELSRKDIVITPLAMVFNYGSDKYADNKVYTLTKEEIASLDRGSVNLIDQAATYNWNSDIGKLSDVFYKAMPIIAPAISIPSILNKEWGNAATIITMYAQVYTINQGLTNISKGAAGRIRPYAYNTALSVDERYDYQNPGQSNVSRSFFSGHTSRVFSSAVFLSKVYQDIYGKSLKSRLVWATSLTAATVTAYARVKAGKHFTSDVLIGAAVGSAIGYLIPHMHLTKSKNVDLAVGGNAVQVSFRF